MFAKNQQSNLQPRSPVVAIVGHVDHGKTTLLDYIRKTSVAGKEAGGITQSIGAYEIWHTPVLTNADGTQTNAEKIQRSSASSPRSSAEGDFTTGSRKITFIDTPGHEAFSRMRARGAAAADLAILVVAADEGVRTQTTEAIEILKKTETPFIVAITKIDTPNANIDKVMRELQGAEVLLEGYGGDVSWHGVSGKTGEGVNELLDLIVLAGEVAGLTFNAEAAARGFVLESKTDSRRGIVAHLILKDGILREGDEIRTPSSGGRVKILEDFLGRKTKELLPSAPASVVGFETLPKAGEEFWIGGTVPESSLSAAGGASLPTQVVVTGEGVKEDKKIKAVLKADTSGSLEVMRQVLAHLIEVVDSSVGEVSDGDVKFAKSTGSAVVGFRVKETKAAANLASSQQVKIITSDIIYKLLEAVEALTKAEEKEKKGGVLGVLATFSATRTKQTVGGKVLEGILRVGQFVQIERGEEAIGRGKIINLKSGKEDIKEAREGSEVGLLMETPTKIETGDTLKTD